MYYLNLRSPQRVQDSGLNHAIKQYLGTVSATHFLFMTSAPATYNRNKSRQTGTILKRHLTFKQWAAALLLFAGFCTATFYCYHLNHADARFERFAENFFLEELKTNPIQFHYSIDDPDAWHIDESQLKLPVYQAGEAANDIYALSLMSDRLSEYDASKLSENNRCLHELLSSYINAASHTAAYPYFAEPLSPSSGTPSELPILLAEYRFDTPEDVELYLAILNQIPAYFDGLIVYEKEKSAAGLFMSDTTADKVIRQCTALMDIRRLEDRSHFLELTFNKRLEPLQTSGLITEAESLAYQSENNRLLTTVVAPAYERLADELTLLKGSGQDTCGLAHYDGGRDYYKALLRMQTGSVRDIDEIKLLLYNDLQSNYKALADLLAADPSLKEQFLNEPELLPQMTPEEILTCLKTSIQQTFPALPGTDSKTGSDVQYTVKYVDDSLEPYTAPAFYMTPPIDNIWKNTIYLNALDTTDDISLFTTLAHEGYPGHLYQTLYSQRYWETSGMTPLRGVLYYGGFVEGWAMYAELSSYDYAVEIVRDSHPEAASYYTACRLDRQIQLCLYALLDIAIHYDGASFEDICSILSAFGSLSEDTMKAVYSYIVEEPCNYPKYYLGYLEIIELKKQAAALWGDNSSAFLYRFHCFLLENGPADFGTLTKLLHNSQ